MKRIKLTQGQVALVDDADYEELVRFKWQAQWCPKTKSFYAVRNTPRIKGRQYRIIMSRVIINLTDSKIKADHRNHDTLDNRRKNLRPATARQNSQNRRGERGASFRKDMGYWQARITVGRVTRHLGFFKTRLAARTAYISANKKYFGEFGGL